MLPDKCAFKRSMVSFLWCIAVALLVVELETESAGQPTGTMPIPKADLQSVPRSAEAITQGTQAEAGSSRFHFIEGRIQWSQGGVFVARQQKKSPGDRVGAAAAGLNILLDVAPRSQATLAAIALDQAGVLHKRRRRLACR